MSENAINCQQFITTNTKVEQVREKIYFALNYYVMPLKNCQTERLNTRLTVMQVACTGREFLKPLGAKVKVWGNVPLENVCRRKDVGKYPSGKCL